MDKIAAAKKKPPEMEQQTQEMEWQRFWAQFEDFPWMKAVTNHFYTTAKKTRKVSIEEKQLVSFKDVAVQFTIEEWSCMNLSQKRLYKEVMIENYGNVSFLNAWYGKESKHEEPHSKRCRTGAEHSDSPGPTAVENLPLRQAQAESTGKLPHLPLKAATGPENGEFMSWRQRVDGFNKNTTQQGNLKKEDHKLSGARMEVEKNTRSSSGSQISFKEISWQNLAQKQRRVCYDIAFKLRVIAYAKEHGNQAAERNFGSPPTEKMIKTWRRQEEDLQKAMPSKHRLRHGIPKWPELEEELKTWILDHQSLGFLVSTKMIIQQARLIADNRGIADFTGSTSWCFRFMKKNDLCMRTKTQIAQKVPTEYEDKIIEFHKFVIKARKSFEL